ncbi:MAG: phosphotransferase [Candidatus Pacebacteria bacterium]|nr:phosphotransferase [Candidatus Paceibacterota bacterium]
MTDHFIQNALSNGNEGKRWLESIPSIISKCEEKWSLQVYPPFNLSYNYVAPVVRSDGTNAVLKIGFPQDREFRTETEALTIFHGEGVVKLLEADPENSIILLEQVKPGKPLSEIEDDEEATRILARVMKKLWKPLPEKHNFITIQEWSTAIPNLRKDFHGTTGPLPTYLVDKAEHLFYKLIVSSGKSVLVHGDLHHDNVLSSERDGWLTIDPKGIAAEPAYEVAAMIRNPYEKLKNISHLEPFLRRRIEILSKELDIHPKRIHEWCLAQTVLSAVWNVKSTKGADHAIRVAETLEKIKFN